MFSKVSKADFSNYLRSLVATLQTGNFIDSDGVFVTQYIVDDECVAYVRVLPPRYEYYVRAFEV